MGCHLEAAYSGRPIYSVQYTFKLQPHTVLFLLKFISESKIDFSASVGKTLYLSIFYIWWAWANLNYRNEKSWRSYHAYNYWKHQVYLIFFQDNLSFSQSFFFLIVPRLSLRINFEVNFIYKANLTQEKECACIKWWSVTLPVIQRYVACRKDPTPQLRLQ